MARLVEPAPPALHRLAPVLCGRRRGAGLARLSVPAGGHLARLLPGRRRRRALPRRTARPAVADPHLLLGAGGGQRRRSRRGRRPRRRRCVEGWVALTPVSGGRAAAGPDLQPGVVRGPGAHRHRVRSRLGRIPGPDRVRRPDRTGIGRGGPGGAVRLRAVSRPATAQHPGAAPFVVGPPKSRVGSPSTTGRPRPSTPARSWTRSSGRSGRCRGRRSCWPPPSP